ncbi:MAG: hypothetical protein K9M03_01940 [Kiritimatiellales bacterium]|nr:hypothetical protein [Kiritimatiellales bacterium]
MLQKYTAYLKDNPNDYWFKRKLFGWGWVPVTWQGWIVIIVFIVCLLGFSLTIDEQSPPQEVMFTFILPLVLLTGALVRICYKKGEKPRWQWGLPKDYFKSNDTSE